MSAPMAAVSACRKDRVASRGLGCVSVAKVPSAMADEAAAQNDAQIQIWKIKKLIKSLEAARGCARTKATASRGGRGSRVWVLRVSAFKEAPGRPEAGQHRSACYRSRLLTPTSRAVRRNGTSMISLILPPKSQISAAAKMLGDEYGTASNIKSRVNRQSVLGAITSTQQRLKLFTKVPPNGLVIYCGTILTEDNKEKKARLSPAHA